MYKNKPDYASLGVSGSVSAIVFSYIIISPLSEIGFFFIPMRAWVAGMILLVLSYILLRKKRKGTHHDPISHESHYSGAIFGILFMILTKFSVVKEFFYIILDSF
jgi:membrane associated rhomboid family serine protease